MPKHRGILSKEAERSSRNGRIPSAALRMLAGIDSNKILIPELVEGPVEAACGVPFDTAYGQSSWVVGSWVDGR